jgi:GAG-pre-integrase domain
LNIGSSTLLTSSTPLLLNNILHVPAISKPLLSISQLIADNDIYVEFNGNSCLVKDQASHQVLIQGIKHNGLYTISTSSPQALIYQQNSIQLWHNRLCHASESTLHSLLRSNQFSCNKDKLALCDSCCLAKAHRLPFSLSNISATKPLKIVHCNV